MAKVTKQKNGRYQRSVKIGKNENGTPIRKFFTGRTLKEVDAKMAAFERQQEEKSIVTDTNMTFAEMGELWLKQYKCTISLGCQKRYAAILRTHLNPSIGNTPLRDLKPLHIKGIVNSLAERDYSEKTITEIKQAAAQVLDAAVENDFLHRNVFAKTSIPKTGQQEREPIGEREQNLIREHHTGHRMCVPALIMLYTGIRKGELLALTWNDLDLENATLSVNKSAWFDNNRVAVKSPKSKAGYRAVPIPKHIMPILKKAKATASSELVCPSARGELMTHTAYISSWRSYLHFLNINAGGRVASRSNPKVQVIEEFTAHQLRHTYATMLYDAGVDVKSAQKFLGHSDLQVTLKIYTHLSEGKEQAAVDALNRFCEAEGETNGE